LIGEIVSAFQIPVLSSPQRSTPADPFRAGTSSTLSSSSQRRAQSGSYAEPYPCVRRTRVEDAIPCRVVRLIGEDLLWSQHEARGGAVRVFRVAAANDWYCAGAGLFRLTPGVILIGALRARVRYHPSYRHEGRFFTLGISQSMFPFAITGAIPLEMQVAMTYIRRHRGWLPLEHARSLQCPLLSLEHRRVRHALLRGAALLSGLNNSPGK